MSSWRQAHTSSYGSESIPLSPIVNPQGASSHPEAGCSHSGDAHPSGSSYSSPNVEQSVSSSGGSHSPTQNDCFNADNIGFSDKTIRRKFVAKVFGILMCQILTTYVFAVLGTFHNIFSDYVKTSVGLKIVAIVLTFGTLLAFAFSQVLRRKYPVNIILMFVFILAESFLVTVFVMGHFPEQVLVTLGITSLFCFGLTVFALQTKIDFTTVRAFLVITVLDFLVGLVVDYFFPSKILTILFCSTAAFTFSTFLLYGVRMIISGENIYAIAPEEYIFASINIYVDMVNIFFHMITTIGCYK